MTEEPRPRWRRAALLRASCVLLLLALCAPRLLAAAPGAFAFGEYDELLRRHVDAQGRVDYAALQRRDAALLDKLVASLAQSGPRRTPERYPGRDAALAYYLSAYNLLVWKNVVQHQPALRRVDQDGFAFFKAPRFVVDGQSLSLDELEKQVIRPRFADARVHFALNCASGGCPRLPAEAFTPERVQQQLQREARRFCNEPRNVALDHKSGRLRLSSLFKWYREEFAGGDVIAFINRHRAADAQLPANAPIDFVDYDWRLNDLTLPAR